MSDPSLELQAAIVAALKGNSPSIVGGRIYDDVPAGAAFPYVSMGDCQVLPDKSGCIDGVEVYPQIDVWSRAVGYPEVKGITKEVLAVLDDQPLTVGGFNVVVFEVESVNYLRDPDGLTHHAAITFHGIITPA
ncbi:MAG: DUF3168 domain-containing protein [Bryobacteraceae bacterium]